jgi:hypothetical protein
MTSAIMLRLSACALAFAFWLPAVDASASTFEPRPSPGAARQGPIRVWVRNAILFPLREVPTLISEMSGSAVPTRTGRPVILDDVRSYGILVEHAELHLHAASLSALMNRYVLPASNGPIKHVDVTFGAGTMALNGVIAKGRTRIRFKATAVPEPTADGDMRIHITKMTAAGFIPKGLLDALGLKASKVAQPRDTAVFHVVGDDLILPIVSMFPPPKFGGRLRSVKVTPSELTAIVGSTAQTHLPALGRSYIHYGGGVIAFAKLVMKNVDLTVVSKEAGGTVGFSPANYYRQLEAGFATVRPDGGLVAHVPNYATLVKARSGPVH